MKKFSFAMTIAILSFLFQSCEKDFNETTTASNIKIGKGFKMLSYNSLPSAEGRTIQTNILSFETEAEFDATLDSLELEYQRFQTDFESTYANLNDSDLNDFIRTTKLDLEEPFTNFENHVGFNSLRKNIIQKEDIWLENPNANNAVFPHNHPVRSHAERSLWNEKGEIMVEGKIYKYTDENFIKIEDGDFYKLAQINNGDSTVYGSPQVYVVSNENPNTLPSNGVICERNSHNDKYYVNNDFRVEYANSLKSKKWEYGKHHMYASTYLYKKVGAYGTSYYRFVGNLRTYATGYLYFNCQNQDAINAGGNVRSDHALIDWKRANAFGVRYTTSPNIFCSEITQHQATVDNIAVLPLTNLNFKPY
jgi:hypothetical protein